jgi:hypothetical protein
MTSVVNITSFTSGPPSYNAVGTVLTINWTATITPPSNPSPTVFYSSVLTSINHPTITHIASVPGSGTTPISGTETITTNAADAILKPLVLTLRIGVTVNVMNYVTSYTIYVFNNSPDVCVRNDTMVHTNMGQVCISNLKPSLDIRLVDLNNNYIKLLRNAVFKPCDKYLLIPKGSLGDNLPSEDFGISDGHPIWFNGEEIMPRTLIEPENKIEFVQNDIGSEFYTLITEERTYVKMNNLTVCTWSQQEFDEFLVKHNIVATYL